MPPSSNESYKMDLTDIDKQQSLEDLLNYLVCAMKFKQMRQGNRRLIVKTVCRHLTTKITTFCWQMTANLSSSVYLNDMKESYTINKIVCIATSQTH